LAYGEKLFFPFGVPECGNERDPDALQSAIRQRFWNLKVSARAASPALFFFGSVGLKKRFSRGHHLAVKTARVVKERWRGRPRTATDRDDGD
jgi:hypothetical protein